MARDGGRGGEDDGGGLLVVVVGAATIKVCNYTAFEAVRGGGEGYFCTVGRLHRDGRGSGAGDGCRW